MRLHNRRVVPKDPANGESSAEFALFKLCGSKSLISRKAADFKNKSAIPALDTWENIG
jgi:hypothetical protein